MRYLLTIIILACGVAMYSCKKYSDPKGVVDPRLTNHYCNDPYAVNYNWGFPGIPDNTVCFYPTDLFQGTYELHDSVFLKEKGFFVRSDTFDIRINRHSTTKMGLTGFCTNGDSLLLTSNINFFATLDTTIGDTTVTVRGQALCSVADTINGSISRDRINDSILYLYFTVWSDTGVATVHLGTAKLKYR